MDVKPHTAIKHRILGAYFAICRNIMKNRKAFYLDLYAGDGVATCEESELKKWDVPFIVSLLEKAEPQKLKLECYLNDISKENYEALKIKLNPYAKFIKRIENKDANKVYKEFLNEIPKDDWSIWFLDPCKHSELNWATIEGIAKHYGTDYTSHCVRHPELIINLMTLTMQRSLEQEEAINKALGVENSKEWKDRINNGERAYEVFLNIFETKLETLGYSCTTFSVTQTKPNTAHLYYLIFASSVPTAQKILKKRFKPYIDRIKKDKWVKENYKFRLIEKAKKQNIMSLTHYWEKSSSKPA